MVNVEGDQPLEDGKGVGISSESLLTIHTHYIVIIKCEEY